MCNEFLVIKMRHYANTKKFIFRGRHLLFYLDDLMAAVIRVK